MQYMEHHPQAGRKPKSELRYNAVLMARLRDPKAVIGRAPDNLSFEERRELAGKYIALEFYTPASLPLRRIEAIGDSAAECIRQLRERGLDPTGFEFTRLAPPC